MAGLLDALLLFLYCCSSPTTSSSKDELTCNALGVEICIQSCLKGEKQVWVTLGHCDLLSSPSKLENYIKDQLIFLNHCCENLSFSNLTLGE